MKILVLMAMVWAAPPVKVSDSQEVVVKESYSVAQTGVETEAFRIQQLFFNKKDVFMVSKLVNGNLYSEKNISPKEYQQIKSTVIGLAAIPNSDLCTTPVTVVVVKKAKEAKHKICGEKENIATAVNKYTDKCKEVLSQADEESK